MIELMFAGGSVPPWHFGQSGQPRPERVRRTPAPVMTTTISSPSVNHASCVNRCGEIV
jgi:hypothetical protein